ncbi:MAG: sporulation protein YqfC [Thermoanaerobacteraceae bacterium]|nr:sporulation protein YqfC [Thermoanaerobacteraceae bacterium]
MLELPKEVILDLPKITLVGTLQLQLENHRGIIEFSEEQVRINTKEGVLVITGEQFFLRNITEQEIVLDGKIKALSYQK